MISNVLLDKSFAFSLRIIKLHQYVNKEYKEYNISRQIFNYGLELCEQLRRGLQAGNSEVLNEKLQAALEVGEATIYRIELLHALGYINDKAANSIITDCRELLTLIKTEQKTKAKPVSSSNDTRNTFEDSLQTAAEDIAAEDIVNEDIAAEDIVNESVDENQSSDISDSSASEETNAPVSFAEWIEADDSVEPPITTEQRAEDVTPPK